MYTSYIWHMSKTFPLFFFSLSLSPFCQSSDVRKRTKEKADEGKKVNVPPVQSSPLGHNSPLFTLPFIYCSHFSSDRNDTLSFFFSLVSPQLKTILVWAPGLEPGALRACVYAMRSTEVLRFHRSPLVPLGRQRDVSSRVLSACVSDCLSSRAHQCTVAAIRHFELPRWLSPLKAQQWHSDFILDYRHGDHEKHNMRYATGKGDQICSSGLFVDADVKVQQLCSEFCACMQIYTMVYIKI